MIPIYALHKGTSKCQKNDEKAPISSVHFFVNISFFGKIIPLHPLPFQKCGGITKEIIPMSMEKLAPPFCQYFWFVNQPPERIYLFVEL